jgi:hypothetical protein
MKVRSKAIWITACGIIIAAIDQNSLGFVDLLAILAVAKILDKFFGDQEDKPTAIESPSKPEIESSTFSLPPGKHLITTGGVKQIRNLMLKHHNMKQTDRDYVDSAMGKDTVAVVAMLNVFLKGK